MVTPFDCLGFAPLDAEAFGTLLDTAAEAGEDLNAPGGSYVLWGPKPGVELWVQVGKKDEILGMNPHFHGEGRVTATYIRVHGNATNPLEGAIEFTVDGVPVVADAPDLARIRHRLAAGTPLNVQLVVFAATLGPASGAPGVLASAARGDGSLGLTGTVVTATIREGLDLPFHHIVLKTATGSWDVVFPATVPLPAVTANVTIRGWVSGRVEASA
jgi:hypothetical protein